ncbi:MAG TPA: hypothetical protein VL360_06325 [Gammaproteobacteria bacterium]|jgi:hypothetical protein|nr:hypothetical protein [Gammaproteobacteria bacterium]
MHSSYSNAEEFTAAIITAALQRDNITLLNMLAHKNDAAKNSLKEAVYALASTGDFETVNYLIDEFDANRYVAADGFINGGFKEHYDKFTHAQASEKSDKMNPLYFIQQPYSLEEYITILAYAAMLDDNRAMIEVQEDGATKGINVKNALSEAVYRLAKAGVADASLRLVNDYGANRHAATTGFAEGGHDEFLAILIASSLMHNKEIKMDVVAEGYAKSGNVAGIINLYNDDLLTQETALDLLKTNSTETNVAEFNLAVAKKERIAAESEAARNTKLLDEMKAAMTAPAAEPVKVAVHPSTIWACSPLSKNIGNASDMVNFLRTKQPGCN